MKGPKLFDIATLVDDVMQAFEEYPPAQLEKVWQHKSYVLDAVQKTKPKPGGSNRTHATTRGDANFSVANWVLIVAYVCW